MQRKTKAADSTGATAQELDRREAFPIDCAGKEDEHPALSPGSGVYFLLAVMKSLAAAEFKPEVGPSDGTRSGNWLHALPDGLEVLVQGDATGPLQRSVDQANTVLANLEPLQQRAVRLLEGFIKDQGAWSLITIDCGAKAERLQCTFILTLYFTADKDPYEYGYTYFDVCFTVPERPHPMDSNGRPVKFVVGFH